MRIHRTLFALALALVLAAAACGGVRQDEPHSLKTVAAPASAVAPRETASPDIGDPNALVWPAGKKSTVAVA